jgi:hypothetical protein
MTKTSKPSLAETHPELAAQAEGWDPNFITHGSHRKLPWKCSRGHKWSAVVKNRANRKTNCPLCPREKRTSVSVASVSIKLASEAHGWDPRKTASRSQKKLEWKCKNGHFWFARVSNRVEGAGCPYCKNQKVSPGNNDLASTHPELASQADGWNPATVMPGTDEIRSWKCNLNHRWRANVHNRTSSKSGCPFCTNQKVLAGYNDLESAFPELALEACGWDPKTVTKKSHKRLKWQCPEGHTWFAEIANRTAGRNCPTCAPNGFDPNLKSWLYLLLNSDKDLLQIGITNVPKYRLSTHFGNGFETVLDLRGPQDGHLTQKLETDCLHALEKRGAILGHKAGINKFDGYTEAWTKKSLNVTSIKQILDWVYEDETVAK